MNPLVGVFFHWLGGLSSAASTSPTNAFAAGHGRSSGSLVALFSWVIAPWALASLRTNDLLGVLGATPGKDAAVVLVLGRNVGLRRTDVRPDDALSRLVTGHGGGARSDHCDRHDGSADLRGTLGSWLATTNGQITFLGILLTLIGIVIVAQARTRQGARHELIRKAERRGGVQSHTRTRDRRSSLA